MDSPLSETGLDDSLLIDRRIGEPHGLSNDNPFRFVPRMLPPLASEDVAVLATHVSVVSIGVSSKEGYCITWGLCGIA
jgi:hypothetical protein